MPSAAGKVAASRARIGRRRLIRGGLALSAAAVGGVGAHALWFEPRWLDVHEIELPVPALSTALEGFTVALVSDLHLTGLTGVHAAFTGAVRALRPNLLIIAGDTIDGAERMPLVRELFPPVTSHCGASIAILGNWEHWGRVPLDALAETFQRVGVRLLGNEHVRLEPGVVVTATDDACSGHARAQDAMRGLPSAELRVFATHAPALLDTLAGAPAFQLAVAGHTHGGQVCVPGLGPWVPPGSGRYLAGMYETPIGKAWVSRGVGTSAFPARLRSRPELAVFRFVRG